MFLLYSIPFGIQYPHWTIAPWVLSIWIRLNYISIWIKFGYISIFILNMVHIKWQNGILLWFCERVWVLCMSDGSCNSILSCLTATTPLQYIRKLTSVPQRSYTYFRAGQCIYNTNETKFKVDLWSLLAPSKYNSSQKVCIVCVCMYI